MPYYWRKKKQNCYLIKSLSLRIITDIYNILTLLEIWISNINYLLFLIIKFKNTIILLLWELLQHFPFPKHILYYYNNKSCFLFNNEIYVGIYVIYTVFEKWTHVATTKTIAVMRSSPQLDITYRDNTVVERYEVTSRIKLPIYCTVKILLKYVDFVNWQLYCLCSRTHVFFLRFVTFCWFLHLNIYFGCLYL